MSRADLVHHMKYPRPRKEPVSHQGVEMWMEVEVFTEGVDGHDGSADYLGKVQCRALKINEAAVDNPAEFVTALCIHE